MLRVIDFDLKKAAREDVEGVVAWIKVKLRGTLSNRDGVGRWLERSLEASSR